MSRFRPRKMTYYREPPKWYWALERYLYYHHNWNCEVHERCKATKIAIMNNAIPRFNLPIARAKMGLVAGISPDWERTRHSAHPYRGGRTYVSTKQIFVITHKGKHSKVRRRNQNKKSEMLRTRSR